MSRWTPLFLAVLPSIALASTPAMVTATTGEVKLVGNGQTEASPDAPFLLKDDQKLEIAEGAAAVLLFEGGATRVTGPATTTVASLSGGSAVKGAGSGASTLDGLLSVKSSMARAGAHRGGINLVRPVPGGDVLKVKEIRWACDCGEQTVDIVDFIEGETVWTGKGTGSVVYDGPELSADSYQIAVGDEHFTVYRANGDKRKQFIAAQQTASTPMDAMVASGDLAGGVSLLTGLYSHLGLDSEALYLVDGMIAKHPDDGGLVALRSSIEKRALPNP